MEEDIKDEEAIDSAEEAKEETKAEDKPLDKPLNKMTAPELRQIAREIPGVSGVHVMKKDELLALIKDFRGIKDEEPVKKKKKTPKPSFSARELKIKIAHLREEKERIRATKDSRLVNILRRRINRLKKQTRKIAQA